MAYGVGITRDQHGRKATLTRKHKVLRNWQILKVFDSKSEAGEYARHAARIEFGQDYDDVEPGPEQAAWSVYIYEY